MKSSLLKALIAAAVLAVGFAALPATAEAGGSSHRCFSHKCGSCGGSIYKKRVVAYRDRCGRPVYRWVRLSHRCAPVRPPSCSHSHHGHHHGIHPAEVIIPILNFIASQQSQQRHYSYPASTAPRPPVSKAPYGEAPYGAGKSSSDAGKSYDSGTNYGTSRSPREYRY